MSGFRVGWLAAGALLSSACTSILGADFDEARAAASASSASTGTTGGSGGAGGSGGPPGGTHLWSKRFGHGDDQELHHLAVDGSSHLLLVGRFKGSIDFGGPPLQSAGDWDMFVVELDPDGNHVWSRSYGSPKDDKATGVATTPDGHVWVTGSINGPMTFGGELLDPGFDGANAGIYDFFVLHLTGDGEHVASVRFGEPSEAQTAYGIAVGLDGATALVGECDERLDLGGVPMEPCDGVGDAFAVSLDGA